MVLDELEFPKVSLTQLPTPFEEAPRFSKALGGPRIFLKRDDTTSLALGGNKARKLEFLIGEALALKSDHVITRGGPQSNHARMTAAASRKYGLEPILVLSGEDPGIRQGNLLLDHLLGARTIFTGSRDPDVVMEEVEQELKAKGKRPYIIPLGGSNALGTLGYVSCAEEILKQSKALGVVPKAVYVATGSFGTLAGLVLGKLLYEASFSVIGVAVMLDAVGKEERVQELILQAKRLLESKIMQLKEQRNLPSGSRISEMISKIHEEQLSNHIKVLGDFVGPGYGIPTRECIEAILLLARSEGVFTDPVYTGKALSALISDVRSGKYKEDDVVVFLHTGGVPADFAYSDIFLNGRE